MSSPVMSRHLTHQGSSKSLDDPNKKKKKKKASATPSVPYIKSVKALFDWTPTEAGGLALCKGEVYGVTKEEGGIYHGSNLAGVSGTFPAGKVAVVLAADAQNMQSLGRRSSMILKKPVKTASSTDLLRESQTGRNRLVRELVETESSYNGFLKELCKLKRTLEGSAFAAEVPGLFGNLDAVASVSDSLLAQFMVVAQSWESNSSIGDPLLNVGPFMISFVEYAKNFNNVLKRLDALQQDPAFVAIMKAQKKDLDFPTLAVMPIQRVPRYKLLLEEVVRQTPEDHADGSRIREALEMVSSIAVTINESVRASEKTQELLEAGKHKQVLADFVKGDRTVLMELPGKAVVTIEEAKNTFKPKGSVFLLSDSLLIILSSTVKDSRSYEQLGFWVSEFSHIFWPSKLLVPKGCNDKEFSIVGPFFHLSIKPHSKKDGASFYKLLVSEVAKHSSQADLKIGGYVWEDYKYDGEWNKEGMMHGKGTMALGQGCVYSGQWVNGRMTGDGKMKLPNGDLLIGRFENGLLGGQGVIDFINGDKFRGAFVNGVRSGHGDFVSAASSVHYSGIWANDTPHGKGTLKMGPDWWSGNFDSGAFVNGQYRNAYGVLYEGTFSQFKLLQGDGKIVYVDGSVYVGQVRDGLRDGMGALDYKDGSHLEAEWKNDKPISGTFIAGAGGHPFKTFTGTMDDLGRPHGKKCKATFPDGSVCNDALFNHGVLEKGVLVFANGMEISGKYARDGHLKGKVRFDNLEGTVSDDGTFMFFKHGPNVRLPIVRPSFPVFLP